MALERAGHRADLEGLRGLAILLVVLFHAGVGVLAGGFVGVDVFFVLSGFFITGMLVREFSRDGAIDLNDFYGKRALRLLPVLLVVLAATLAAVTLLYAPIDRAAVASTARPVALYSANIEFARTSVNYFGSGDNPFLHTWSLAVEEQFYLVWPLLFVLVAAIYDRKAGEGTDPETAARRRLLIGIGVIGAGSLVASLVLTRASQSWAFFGMPTRIWEFAVGGALALRMEHPAEANPRAGTILQWLGLAALGLAVLTYDAMTPYPGIAALLPVLGAAGFIVGGERAPDSTVSRALSAGWLRWFGALSYAWYLWHWPLVGVGGVLDPTIGVVGKLLWSAAALALAWLTHRMIERPARERWFANTPARWIAPAAVGVSVAAAVGAHGVMSLAERRVARPDQRMYAAAREDRVADACWAETVDVPRKPCEFGDQTAEKVLVLLGDSHAQHWIAGLDQAGREHGWKIIAMVKGGCPVADVPGLRRQRHLYEECTRYRDAMLRRIVAMRPYGVILSSWDHYMPANGKRELWHVTAVDWSRGLRRTYARLHAAGIRTVAIRGTPRTWFDVPACLSRRAARLPFARSCDYDRATALSADGVRAQNAAARGLNVSFVDMNDQICATARCSPVKNGTIVFTDDNHLTASFSRSVASTLGARIAASLDGR